MLKTEAKYITKTAGNDCVIMRCGLTEKKKNQCNGEENRKIGERRKQLYRD